jgi:hypothetical protein
MPEPLESEIITLKRQLHITPKTAILLIKSGYADYTKLADVSPEYVSKQFQDVLGLTDKLAYAYKRALRRMVWLGTQNSPERFGKNCSEWTDKALKRQGWWCEGFDRLTGREMERRMKETSVQETKLAAKKTSGTKRRKRPKN